MSKRVSTNQAPSNRQLKVGETIREALAEIFAYGQTHVPVLDSASITISEVRISPDLKNATVYFTPLGGERKDDVLQALKDNVGQVRRVMNSKLVLRYSPKLYFKLDNSFDNANRIHDLLNHEKVTEDLAKEVVEATDDGE